MFDFKRNVKTIKNLTSQLTETRLCAIEYKTGLSRDEIRAWYTEFLKEFPLGQINKREFIALFLKNSPLENAEKYAKIVFESFQSRKKAQIGFDELFLNFFIIGTKGSREEKIQIAFDIFDSDKNSNFNLAHFNHSANFLLILIILKDRINRKEMERCFQAIYMMSGLQSRRGKLMARKMLKKYDFDRDGSLNLNEFARFISESQMLSEIFNLN